jgi:hypothetical protein
MTYRIEDFVNRDLALAALWSMVRLETEHRILVLHGRDGIGKTSLLKQFREECQKERIACGLFNFGELLDQSYLGVTLDLEEQLGPKGFEHLDQVIAETSDLGPWAAVGAESVVSRLGRDVVEPAAASGRSGGVDFYDKATVYGDVVGGDQINVIRMSRSEDPRTQRMIQTRVTDALRDCLIAFSATRPAVILLDSWHEAPEDTRRWLQDHLLSWIVRIELPRAIAVITCKDVPDLNRLPQRTPHFSLQSLPRDAVELYWVKKRQLPSDEVDDVMKYSGGIPNGMVVMAELRTLTLGASLGTGNLS